MKFQGKGSTCCWIILGVLCIVSSACGGGTIGTSGGGERSFVGVVRAADGRPLSGVQMELFGETDADLVAVSRVDDAGQFSMEASVGSQAAIRISGAQPSSRLSLSELPPAPAKIGLALQEGMLAMRTDVQILPRTNCEDILSVGLNVKQIRPVRDDRICNLSLVISDSRGGSKLTSVALSTRACGSQRWIGQSGLTVNSEGRVDAPVLITPECQDHRITVYGAVPIEIFIRGEGSE